MVIFYVITIIFGILSVVFLSGKGAFLIAGYNTSSAKDKAKYDEKKLCRLMGSACTAITISSLPVCIFGIEVQWTLMLFTVVLFVSIIAIMFLSGIVCYTDEFKQNKREYLAEKKKSNRFSTVISIIMIAIMVFVFVMLVTGDVKYEYKDNYVVVDAAFWSGESIYYDQIESVTYKDQLEVGERTNGLGSFRLNEGGFHNGEYGKYTLYSYVGCHEFVELKTSKGIIVLNAETPEATKQIYETLLEKTE